jgi:Glycosyl transferase family 2
MPFFSVIIPTYNREHWIRQTLESVLAQRFTDYEILIVDDGSTDGTARILEEFGSKIRVFHQVNRGPGAARNLGIQQAQGQYTAFLDSDDLWFPWTLEICHSILKQTHSPAFLAGTAIFFADEQSLTSVTPSAPVFKAYPDYYASSAESLWLGTCSVMVQTEVLQQVQGFTQEWINGEDSDLWMKLGTQQGFIFIESPALFGYRQLPRSAVSNQEKTLAGMHYLIAQEQGNHYPGASQRQQERLALLTRHTRPVTLACLRQGDIAQGWLLFQKTLPWNLRLKRYRYLFGFLGMVVVAQLSQTIKRITGSIPQLSKIQN